MVASTELYLSRIELVYGIGIILRTDIQLNTIFLLWKIVTDVTCAISIY